jgi:hypothetical protein
VGDDVALHTDETRTTELQRFHFLRQQANREGSEPCRSLADFIAPKETGLADTIGAFAVSSGIGLNELCDGFRDRNAARAAIQRAKSEELLRGVFLGFGDEVDVIANGIARLLQFHLDRRSDKQLEVMQFLRMGNSQVQIAAKLGLSSQVVNKRKKPVGWEAFKAGEEALKESLLLGVARVTR